MNQILAAQSPSPSPSPSQNPSHLVDQNLALNLNILESVTSIQSIQSVTNIQSLQSLQITDQLMHHSSQQLL